MTLRHRHKYIFVIGGVMSGIGKGITTASIGKILQGKGYRVNLMKVDPYLNVDAGTMNPTEHGETFVLNSGLETDQDMGNYERFLGVDAVTEDYVTSGMVYYNVLTRERALGYGGKCVEAMPDIVNEITDKITHAKRHGRSDVTVVEIGGTIGDYQNTLFIEAARVMKIEHPNDVVFVLVSYVPMPKSIGEMKTRPTRIAAQALNSYGVQADFIIARSDVVMDTKRREKLAAGCMIPPAHVISAPDVKSIYDVPLNFDKDHIGNLLLKHLGLSHKKNDLRDWQTFVHKKNRAKKEISIAIVGKYFDTGDFTLADSYISVIEAIKISAWTLGYTPKLTWLNAKHFEQDVSLLRKVGSFDGVIVPGGFGSSGVEGKIAVIKYVREHHIPFFGLCYGMQLAVVESARHILKWNDAHTTEIAKNTTHPVIDILPEQKELLKAGHYGATMRLGAYQANLQKGSIAARAYTTLKISERHRHRYEVNLDYISELERAGLVFSGRSPDGKLMEIVELPKSVHPFFLGTQFHPEFKARPTSPHPLFSAFIIAATKRRLKKTKSV
ncbi:MAG: CTP synthase [Candidatus Campbellbacteria bacterium]|nr:CTP synthase [Candidatus Campbellbacteria bacterium]